MEDYMTLGQFLRSFDGYAIEPRIDYLGLQELYNYLVELPDGLGECYLNDPIETFITFVEYDSLDEMRAEIGEYYEPDHIVHTSYGTIIVSVR